MLVLNARAKRRGRPLKDAAACPWSQPACSAHADASQLIPALHTDQLPHAAFLCCGQGGGRSTTQSGRTVEYDVCKGGIHSGHRRGAHPAASAMRSEERGGDLLRAALVAPRKPSENMVRCCASNAHAARWTALGFVPHAMPPSTGAACMAASRAFHLLRSTA